MNKLQLLLTSVLCATGVLFCRAQEKIMFLNEGIWQQDNGRLSYFEDGAIVSNSLFRDVNGYKLGDTPNCIIQLDDKRLAISLNWSNIIQFIDTEGKALAATEDIPNNRWMVSDGSYLYVTSYAHDVVVEGIPYTFTRGYVAKIDLSSYKTVAAVQVGYEPEGIALYGGRLFVANSGGYAFQEGHDYERTVSVIDPTTMKVTRTVDTGIPNLYGYMSRSGQYLCINSPGDYYDVDAATVIFDCQAAIDGKADADCCAVLDKPSTYNTVTSDGKFMAIGAAYSYTTGESSFYTLVIDPAEAFRTKGKSGVSERMPGNMAADIRGMQSPYSIYVNPYTGYMYGTDAGDNASTGRLYQWTPEGRLTGVFSTYINPGHILALPPDGQFSGVGDILRNPVSESDTTVYNLQGIPVARPVPGNIYIRSGKKFIHR